MFLVFVLSAIRGSLGAGVPRVPGDGAGTRCGHRGDQPFARETLQPGTEGTERRV